MAHLWRLRKTSGPAGSWLRMTVHSERALYASEGNSMIGIGAVLLVIDGHRDGEGA